MHIFSSSATQQDFLIQKHQILFAEDSSGSTA